MLKNGDVFEQKNIEARLNSALSEILKHEDWHIRYPMYKRLEFFIDEFLKTTFEETKTNKGESNYE